MLLVDGRSRRMVDGNEAFCRLSGYERSELSGRSVQEIHTGEAAEVDEHLLLAVACGDDGPRHYSLRTKEGSELNVDIQAVPLEGTRGRLLALYVRDARGEREAERDRSALQSQLWMAQKHEAVGRLAAGIAHDFNSLLSAVMLTTESLRERLAQDEEACGNLDIIAEAGLRARELTGELLAFSGRQMLEPRPLSLNDVVRAMESLIRRTLPADIDISIHPASEAAAVSADPAQMQQVLLNLVLNGRDAMPDGGRLVITVQEVELDEEFARDYSFVHPGPHVMLSVTDTGMGMDEETQARIFEPFFSTRERGSGAGLGLATVYGIVKQSGGTIWVTSQPGIGTTFRVYLPRIDESGLETYTPEERRSGSAGRGSEHVLLVEDDESVLKLTARMLRDLGYQVTEAHSGDEALEIHDELWPHSGPHPIDLLVTDVVMPGTSGLELGRRIRLKREDLKILFISGYLDPSGTEESRVPIEPLLPKPFTKLEMAQALRTLLDG
jgi:PAS domain S-box-containing protein